MGPDEVAALTAENKRLREMIRWLLPMAERGAAKPDHEGPCNTGCDNDDCLAAHHEAEFLAEVRDEGRQMSPLLVPCATCGSEGRIIRGQYDERDCGECPDCGGTGMEEVETMPAERDDDLPIPRNIDEVTP